MAFSKVTLNGDTLMDVTQKTVTAATMLSGTTALKNDGTDITGNIPSKSSSDLTVSGATVTAPAGFYSVAASKSVASGSATTPATTITANPSMTATINSGKNLFDMDCLLEADGWVEDNGDYYGQIRRVLEEYPVGTGVPIYGGLKENTQYTVSLTVRIDSEQGTNNGLTVVAYYSDDTHANVCGALRNQTTWTRISGTTTSGKTVTEICISYSNGGANVWHIKEAQIEEGTTLTDYTPYAMQAVVNATVSASQSVTPTVSAGYVSTGTAGTVSVGGSGSETVFLSDLVSGTKTITSNGTGIDVAKYASVDVSVSGGSSVDVEPLSVTTNGTYTAPTGTAYSPVTVNVSGGGTTPASPKDVNFIDYDGTILYSYTKAEFAQLTALPANPDHSGDEIPLTSQGWNWTLAQINAQLTAQPNDPVTVGQMYVTTDGKTYIEIELHEGRLSPYLGIAVNGTVVVDWGDNTATSTVTGTSLTTQIRTLHEYAAAGRYKISISVSSGSFAFCGTSTYTLLNKNSSSGNQNRVYSNAVQSVRIGNNASIGSYAFPNCYSLALITIPSGITSIGSNAFYYCYSLASITIPSEVTSIAQYVFQYCASLASITIPSGVTSIDSYAFPSCYSLASITIPSGVTSIGTYTFQNCYSLASITIPSGVTSIGTYTFQTCYSLASITIPTVVTSIGSYAFQSCYGLGKLRFLPTTPPTVANSNAFTNIPTDCVISVPTGKKTAYTGASNYPSSSTYTYIEE